MTQSMKDHVAFAEQLADVAGDVLRQYYRSDFGVERKADDSPVTIADREAEAAMRALIQEHYPTYGVLGEEEEYTHEDAEWCWTLDPIDGTVSFIAGRPLFGTLIGLTHKGKPVLGVIDQPITGDRWVGGQDYPATLNGKPVKVRDCKDIEEAVIATSGPHYFSPVAQVAYMNLADNAGYQIYGGDCYNYGLIASGNVDLVVEAGLQPHDYIPLVAIIEAAGGVCIDWDGEPVTLESDGTIIAAGTAEVAAVSLELLAADLDVNEELYDEFAAMLLEEMDESA